MSRKWGRLLKRNIGVCHERVNIKHNDGMPNWEKVFQREWNEENRPISYINQGFGTLQDLFIVDKKYAEGFNGGKIGRAHV